MQILGKGRLMTKTAEMKNHNLFDPRGVVAISSRPLANRKNNLDGLRLGVLDNSNGMQTKSYAALLPLCLKLLILQR